mgnify:CR=1
MDNILFGAVSSRTRRYHRVLKRCIPQPEMTLNEPDWVNGRQVILRLPYPGRGGLNCFHSAVGRTRSAAWGVWLEQMHQRTHSLASVLRKYG